MTLQGCLPPDWSFCDCDFRDNFWNHVLNDIHMLFDGPDFARKARDNSTFQGKYLQSPPEGLDCPEQAMVFWKAWPQFGMSRGLIEGSMGDLWMPGARDRIKQVCMAGHLALCVICSQHFLVKAGRTIEAGEQNYMRWMEAAYGHMIAIRNLGQAHQLRSCMGQQGWPLKVWDLHAYAEKWLGREVDGTSPMAAYLGGQLDPFQMLFDKPMAHTEKSRLDSLPDRRPCVPLKNPQCWKRMSKLLVDTCEHCCSPFIHKSGRGDPWCFDSVWTFERCCQPDFIDLVCELKRSGEEGGCVDCQKSVHYTCLTPPEKRLQESQDNYNSKVDKYNGLQADAQRLSKEVAEARDDLVSKDGIYQEKYREFDSRLQSWTEAFNNVSRLVSEGRLQQQHITWNSSAKALDTARMALHSAQGVLRNVTDVLNGARDAEAQGQEVVARNESMHSAAIRALDDARSRLAELQAVQEAVAAAAADADAQAASAAAAEMLHHEQVVEARRSRDRIYEGTAVDLERALVKQHTSEKTVKDAALADARAQAAVQLSQIKNSSVHATLDSVVSLMVVVDEREAAARASVHTASGALDNATQLLHLRKEELESIENTEMAAQELLLTTTHRSSAVQCLILSTPANASARPRAGSTSSPLDSRASNDTCQEFPVAEDKNEFCNSWARAGECERNPEYMARSCPLSCSKAPMPCSGLLTHTQAALPEADLAALMLEVVSLASSLSGEPQNSEDVTVPGKVRTEVKAAAAALKLAQEHEQSAVSRVEHARSALGEAQQVLQEAMQQEEVARQIRMEAFSFVVSAEERVWEWQRLVLDNETIVARAQDAIEAREDEHHRLQVAANQSLALEQGLGKAKTLAEDSASQTREAASRLSRRCLVLENHIKTLNMSISENLTTVVSAWLQADGSAAMDTASGASWGSRLLHRVKSAVVSMIASIERFLETYVMSLTDKETIAELIRAVEDLKAASLKLIEVEAAALNAEVQAQDVRKSLSKASASRARAEQSVKDGTERIKEAQGAFRIVDENLQQAKSGHDAARVQLQEMQNKLKIRDNELKAAAAVVASANGLVGERADQVQSSKNDVETAMAEVVEAKFALAAAESSRLAAEASAVGEYFAELRQKCGASAAEFETYLQHREFLSLLRAVVVRRTQAHSATSTLHAEAASNYSATVIMHNMSHDTVLDVRHIYNDRLEEAAVADKKMNIQEEERRSTAAQLSFVRGGLQRDQAYVASILQIRMQTEAAVLNATTAHDVHILQANAALQRHNTQVELLKLAMNATYLQSRAVETAEAHEAQIMQEWMAAKIWLADFVESLLLGEKEQAVKMAARKESDMQAAEARASHREQQMKALLQTHERHLRLLNLQVGLEEKEAARVFARDEFKKAEQAFLDAQTKLNTLLKTQADTGESIAKTYEELQTLLEEHRLAKGAYEKQDPEERKRSFSTKLSGSGPDPNGIDLR